MHLIQYWVRERLVGAEQLLQLLKVFFPVLLAFEVLVRFFAVFFAEM